MTAIENTTPANAGTRRSRSATTLVWTAIRASMSAARPTTATSRAHFSAFSRYVSGFDISHILSKIARPRHGASVKVQAGLRRDEVRVF
jgi:hypothetical protein